MRDGSKKKRKRRSVNPSPSQSISLSVSETARSLALSHTHNGGPGTIKKITMIEGEETKYVLHRVDAIDEAAFVYNFSIIEGTGLPDTLEKVQFESQLVEGTNGGSIRKVRVQFFTKGDAILSEEELKANQAKIQGLVKLVEGYLLANPDY